MLDTRKAATPEQPPTGDGAIVLHEVDVIIRNHINRTTHGWTGRAITNPENLKALYADLAARAEVGKKKYGTYLRVNNGRSAIVDTYQEIQDAIMYATQARMEGDTEAGALVEILIQLGSMLAGELNKRTTERLGG